MPVRPVKGRKLQIRSLIARAGTSTALKSKKEKRSLVKHNLFYGLLVDLYTDPKLHLPEIE